MASLLDFLTNNAGQPGGLLGNLVPPPQDQQAQPQMPPAFAGAGPGAASSQGGGGFGNFLSSNPLMLMALGGGIAQGGIGRGLTAAVPAAQYEQQQQKQQLSQGATYQALRKAGMPDGVAQAAALNPEMLKTIAPEYFGGFKVVQTGESALGNKTFMMQGPGGKLIPLPGAAGGGSEPTSADGTPLMGQEYMDYLKKTDPTGAAGVEGLLSGHITAAGRNLQKLIPLASRVDKNFDMNVFTQRKNLAAEAGKATPNTFGGQRNSGNTAIAHLATIADRIKELGNVDIGAFPTISGWINWARQEGTSEQKSKANALNDAIDRYVSDLRGGKPPSTPSIVTPAGSMIGKPGERIIGAGEWQTLPTGVRIREIK
jgi:hypothetical protein